MKVGRVKVRNEVLAMHEAAFAKSGNVDIVGRTPIGGGMTELQLQGDGLPDECTVTGPLLITAVSWMTGGEAEGNYILDSLAIFH